MRRHRSGHRSRDKLRRHASSRARFAVCIKNKGYETSLERGKLYRVIRDLEVAKHGYVRIVDEDGGDYGYSADRFIALDLPTPVQKALFRTRGR